MPIVLASPRVLFRRVIVLAAWVVLIWLAVLLAVRVAAAGGGADPAPAVSSYSAASVLPGCILLSASEDPLGHRHGMDHPYAGYPVVMTLACISFNDVETAQALFPVEVTSRDESLAQGGVVPY